MALCLFASFPPRAPCSFHSSLTKDWLMMLYQTHDRIAGVFLLFGGGSEALINMTVTSGSPWRGPHSHFSSVWAGCSRRCRGVGRGLLWGESSFLVMKPSERRAHRHTDDANKHSDLVLLQSLHGIWKKTEHFRERERERQREREERDRKTEKRGGEKKKVWRFCLVVNCLTFYVWFGSA